MIRLLLKRTVSLILAFVMIFSMLPTMAFAEEMTDETQVPAVEEMPEPSQDASEENSEEPSEEPSEDTAEETSEETAGESFEEPAEESSEEPAEEIEEESSEDSTADSEALNNVLAQMESLKAAYYRAYEGELWVLFETMMVVTPVEEMVAFYTAYEAAMMAYNELTEEEKALVDAAYAAEMDFFLQYYMAIQQKMSEPMLMGLKRSSFDTSVTGDYYNVLSEKEYNIISGVTETEIVMNNASGTRRQAFRFFSIDPLSSSIQLVPGYYQIDKYATDPTNKAYQKDCKVTDMAAYYESTLGYDIVGGMNTALAYDSNAPYSFLMWEGQVLQDKNDSFGLGHSWLNQHSGSCSTYLAVKKDGSVELRGGSEPFQADDWNCIGANFGWLVKDGRLVKSTAERTSSAASRSMVGIKADGTLILCQTDGRGANNSVGQSDYEMGEMMLALGCVQAFNCDGGGSSTFISQRAGESGLTMRSTPSDGSERPTLNAIFIAKAKNMVAGTFDSANIKSEYDYFAPYTTYTFTAEAIDTTGAVMAMPNGGEWTLSDDSFGTITDGVFVSGGKLGEVVVKYTVSGKTFEYPITIVHPDSFGFGADGTVIPYGKSVVLTPTVQYGEDSWDVYYQADTFTWAFTDETVGIWDAETLTYTASSDESKKGPKLTVTYKYADTLPAVSYALDFGKGSEIVAGWDFEDGDVSDWMGFSDAKAWSIANGVNNTLVGSDPLAGQFSPENDAHTFLATADNGQVKNGKYALGVTYDNSDSSFRGWTYNVLFNVGDVRVFRDVANGMNATTLGFWLYIPEGAAGLAFQSQFNASPDHTKPSCKQDHFMFTTVSGARKNLNSCTEEDIPANRWVYASIDISKYDYLSTMPPMDESNSRSPSWMRTYIKPEFPAQLTFYIDDITLDYSAAVEDRNAPEITDAKYTTADESIALANGTVINGNSIAFTATIAESNGSGEISGLNLDTAKIYIDGNEVETETSKTTMATKSNVELANGQHRVTFEIEDNWRNRTQLSYEITVAGEKNTLAELSGHNDLGNVPEADSVYYVDINTSAAETVAIIEATIQLNTANTWELENMIVAPGFEVEWMRLDDVRHAVATYSARTDIHAVDNVIAIALTRKDDCALTGEQTLLSIPVRVWSWNGFNNVTDKAEPAPANKPTVTIDYTILNGYVESTDGDVIEFGGTRSVATTMTGALVPDGYTYHEHIAVPMTDKSATCAEAGYTGRIYCGAADAVFTEHAECAACKASGKVDEADCETCGGDGVVMCKSTSCTVCKVGCGSVIAWGETIDPLSHAYVRVGAGTEDDHIECSICEEQMTGSGLVQAGDDWYYLIAGNLTNGWQTIDGEWYYFRSSTKKAAQGVVRHQLGSTVFLDYEFENGKLLDGIWYEAAAGMRYYYGPNYYKLTWADIDGATYYFGEDGIRFEGYRTIKDSRFSKDDDYRMYQFDENGKYIRTMTGNGLLVTDNGTYYLVDGYARYSGLMLIDNEYYYFRSNGIAATGEYKVSKTNGLLPEGTYTFDETGKMIKKNGFEGEYYYVDGVVHMTGMTKVGDDYYYFSTTNGQMTRNTTRAVYIFDVSCEAGKFVSGATYTFDAEGKLVIPVKNGFEGDYYYVDGEIQMTGMTKVGDDYYYFSTTNGQMTRNITRTVYIFDGSCEAGKFVSGETYTFDAEGKLVLPVKNGFDGDYYYVDGVIQMTGMTKIGDDYYYFSTTDGKMSRNTTRTVYIFDASCEEGKFIPGDTYTFDAEGKLAISVKNGFEGNYYYYVDGVIQMTGMTKVGNDYYYFSTTDGKMTRNTTRTVYIFDGSCEAGKFVSGATYTFDAEGKLVLTIKNGFDGDYYYVDDVIQMTGMTKIGDDYYYFSTTNGKMTRSTTRTVYIFDISCEGKFTAGATYTFDAEGKLVF